MQNGYDRWPRAINYFIQGIFIVCVLIVLAVLILPMLHRTHHTADRAACLNHLHLIMAAIEAYAADYDGYFPTSAEPNEPIQTRTHYRDLGILYPRYIEALEIFVCPHSGDMMPKQRANNTHDSKPFLNAEAGQVSYAYSYDGSSEENLPWTEAAPCTTRILADRPASKDISRHRNHKIIGRNVAFHDGHVAWVSGKKKLLTDPDNPDPKVANKCWWSER
jgi:prepilin-type processing-associated H-X9-DG protein